MRGALVLVGICLFIVLPAAAQDTLLPTVAWTDGTTTWASFQGTEPVVLAEEPVYGAVASPDGTRFAYSTRDGIFVLDTAAQNLHQTLPISIIPPAESDSVFNVFERLNWLHDDTLIFAVGLDSDEPLGGMDMGDLPYYTWTLSTNETQPLNLPDLATDFSFSPDGQHIVILNSGEVGLPDSAGTVTLLPTSDLTPIGDPTLYHPNYYLDEALGRNVLLFPEVFWNATSDMFAFDLTTLNSVDYTSATSWASDTVCRQTIVSEPLCLPLETVGRNFVWNADLTRFVYTLETPASPTKQYQVGTWSADNTLTFQPIRFEGYTTFAWLDADTLLAQDKQAAPYGLSIVNIDTNTTEPFLPDAGIISDVAVLDESYLALATLADDETTIHLVNYVTGETTVLGTYIGRFYFWVGALQ